MAWTTFFIPIVVCIRTGRKNFLTGWLAALMSKPDVRGIAREEQFFFPIHWLCQFGFCMHYLNCKHEIKSDDSYWKEDNEIWEAYKKDCWKRNACHIETVFWLLPSLILVFGFLSYLFTWSVDFDIFLSLYVRRLDFNLRALHGKIFLAAIFH